MYSQPFVIEFVGLAGSGKTTLLEELSRRTGDIKSASPPPRTIYLPFLMKLTFQWFPRSLANRNVFGKLSTIKEIRSMAYLSCWLPYLAGQIGDSNKLIALDPGSVHWLSFLREFGSKLTKNRGFIVWWNEVFHQWTKATKGIIFLDAPNHLLYERIIYRRDWHEIKTYTRVNAYSELDRYRKWYKHLVYTMELVHGTKVFHFRTDQISTKQMADTVIHAF